MEYSKSKFPRAIAAAAAPNQQTPWIATGMAPQESKNKKDKLKQK
jgi:hypothetical protein